MKDIIIKYWIEFILGLITTGLGVAFKSLAKKYKANHDKVNKNAEDVSKIKQAIVAILATSITTSYDKCMEKNYCSVNMLRSITTEYNFYMEFGGDGTITTLYNEIVSLSHHRSHDEVSESEDE